MTEFFELPSPFPELPGRVRAIETQESAPADLHEQLLAGTYARPFLVEDDQRRLLLFNLDFVQSEMRIAEPDALSTPYTQAMMAFLLFHTNARQLLLLGLGGGSLAKFCHRRLPLATLTAVEADPDVLKFRSAFCIPPDSVRFRVVEADAADFVRQLKTPVDVMLVDAYDRAGCASSLREESFYRSAWRAMGPRGVLVANLAGEAAERRGHLDLIVEAFGDNVLVIDVDAGANHVVFAFRDPRFEPRWKWIGSQAAAMKVRYGLDFPGLVRRLEKAAQTGWESAISIKA